MVGIEISLRANQHVASLVCVHRSASHLARGLVDGTATMSMTEDVLRQLLEELLTSADETAPVGHGSSADDIDINKQVIELVVNAGLMALPNTALTGNGPRLGPPVDSP